MNHNHKYSNKFIHPIDPTIRDVSHILWVGNKINESSSSRNAVFYGDKAIENVSDSTVSRITTNKLQESFNLKPPSTDDML